MQMKSVRQLSWSVFGGLLLVGALPGLVSAAELGQAMEPDSTKILPGLLPVLGAATGVERVMELGWNFLEWILLRFVRWRPSDLKTPSYVGFKGGISLLAGLFLGVVISNYTGMRLMGYLYPLIPGLLEEVPNQWDIIITGLVIGAGTKPAHDILGIITQLKNWVSNSALKQRELAAAALADAVLKLRQADAPSSYRVDVPGVGTTQVPGAPAQTARNRMIDEIGHGSRERTIDRYAKAIHDNLYTGSS